MVIEIILNKSFGYLTSQSTNVLEGGFNFNIWFKAEINRQDCLSLALMALISDQLI